MNHRPILIAICAAVAFVAFVYFYGKQHFSEPSVDSFVHDEVIVSTPTTVDTPTTETTYSGDTAGESRRTSDSDVQTKTPTKTIDELHRREAELKRKIAEGLTQLKLQEQKLAKQEQILAEHEAKKKASEEQEKQITAELEAFNLWLDTEILPEVDTLLPDIERLRSLKLTTVEAYVKRFPDPADQRYYANKLARYKVNQDKLVDYIVNNTSKLFQERFINDAIADWGEERSKHIVDAIREKAGR